MNIPHRKGQQENMHFCTLPIGEGEIPGEPELPVALWSVFTLSLYPKSSCPEAVL